MYTLCPLYFKSVTNIKSPYFVSNHSLNCAIFTPKLVDNISGIFAESDTD